MKVSVVTTVRNEEQTVAKLLDSLITQTKKPEEIVIVDGGSTDATASVISNFQFPISNAKVRFKFLVKRGITIAQGRNIAIQNAENEIIAMIDAGCIAKADWLEKITEPFTQKDVDVVAGFYLMTGDSPLQKAAAPFLGIAPQRFDTKTFLPSARSMAFTKVIWDKVGGFSEIFSYAGEDTHFNYKIMKAGGSIARVKDAIVYWEVPNTLRENIKKFYYYARGDAQSGIWWHPIQGSATHTLKIIIILARYLVGLLIVFFAFFFPLLFSFLIIGFGLYLFWAIFKMRDIVTEPKARMWIPVIQVASDFAVMAGFISGIIHKY